MNNKIQFMGQICGTEGCSKEQIKHDKLIL